MKKILCQLVLLALLAAAGSVCAFASEGGTEPEAAETYDFRETTWGMSKEQVKAIEGEPMVEDENLLVYTGEAAGSPVDILYSFEDDELISGIYDFTDEHINNNLYYEDYLSLVEAYSEKYGKPISQTENWKNDLYKDDPGNWGMAVAMGNVTFLSKWETDTTDIHVILRGDNLEVFLDSMYEKKDYEQKINTDGI